MRHFFIVSVRAFRSIEKYVEFVLKEVVKEEDDGKMYVLKELEEITKKIESSNCFYFLKHTYTRAFEPKQGYMHHPN